MIQKILILAFVLAMLSAAAFADGVGISKDIMSVTVDTPAGLVEIKRNQDNKNTINPMFSKTSRKCPPFCIQPHEAAPGVQTVGELEVIKFIAEKKGIVVDTRVIDWHIRGTIPGAKNIPFTEIASRLDELGCTKTGENWDCANARDVCLFCNGLWCGQSSVAIRSMLKERYPANKIRYFRNGMQGWESLGLTVVEGTF